MTTIPFKKVSIAVSDNLDFYANMLGNTGMNSKWCPFCQLGTSEWTMMTKCEGDTWTRAVMDETLQNIHADT